MRGQARDPENTLLSGCGLLLSCCRESQMGSQRAPGPVASDVCWTRSFHRAASALSPWQKLQWAAGQREPGAGPALRPASSRGSAATCWALWAWQAERRAWAGASDGLLHNHCLPPGVLGMSEAGCEVPTRGWATLRLGDTLLPTSFLWPAGKALPSPPWSPAQQLGQRDWT